MICGTYLAPDPADDQAAGTQSKAHPKRTTKKKFVGLGVAGVCAGAVIVALGLAARQGGGGAALPAP